MCLECGPLIKAIDRYLAKADDDLEEELGEEGYEDPHGTVECMNELEDGITESLENETDAIASGLEEAEDTSDFATRIWPGIKNKDRVNKDIAAVFSAIMYEFLPACMENYIQSTDKDLHCDRMSERSIAWIDEWAEELGNIMRLDSHNEIQEILDGGIRDGVGIEEITRRILESGIRDERYKARRVAVTEVLTAHRAAQQEAFMQSPAVEGKKWRHSGPYRIKPRQNHVAMDGTVVPKADAFRLTGADGGVYFPMYPGDTSLPPGERINCHCLCQPVVDKGILGMSLEERQKLQQQAIDEMDDEWEKELDARNRAKAGIEIEPFSRDISRRYLKKATPGQGDITYEPNYLKNQHRSEVEISKKVHELFGGNIKLLNDREKRQNGIKKPDYEWNGLYWELKEPQSMKESATSDLFRTAKKQIKEKPGGVIFNYQCDDFDLNGAEKAMLDRFSRKDFDIRMVDVMIFHKGELKKIVRFEK